MKIITKIEQLIPGEKVNVYSPKGTKIEHELIVESVFAYTVKLYGMEFAITFGGNTFELVSYPERRKLTPENYYSGMQMWIVENGVVYIDPPHPEVKDITPPWEVEGKKSTPLECPNYEENENITEPDDKVKRLWWIYLNGSEEYLFYSNVAKTEKELVEDIKKNQVRFPRKYAPGPIVPDESEWKEVK